MKHLFGLGVRGGIAGSNSGEIKNCKNYYSGGGCSDDVMFDQTWGGIVGENSGTVKNSINYYSPVIGGSNRYAGGITGKNSGTIEECENKGSLSLYGDCSVVAGGLAGYNNGIIKYSESNANINYGGGSCDFTYVGLLVGKTGEQAEIIESTATGSLVEM